MKAIDVITWLSPEIILVLSSIVLYIVFNKLVVERTELLAEEANVVLHVQTKKRKYPFLVTIGELQREQARLFACSCVACFTLRCTCAASFSVQVG